MYEVKTWGLDHESAQHIQTVRLIVCKADIIAWGWRKRKAHMEPKIEDSSSTGTMESNPSAIIVKIKQRERRLPDELGARSHILYRLLTRRCFITGQHPNFIHSSVYLSVFGHLSGYRLSPSHTLKLLPGYPDNFPDKMGYVMLPACSGPALGSCPCLTCLENL